MSDRPGTTKERDQLERALLALRQMRARLDRIERERSEPIAIVGIGCRLPGGVNDPEAFWTLLRGGVDAVSEVPSDRWDAQAFFSDDPQARGKIPSKFGGFLDDIASFDPHFFGISPREASAMDPQQRLALEVAWEALEDAGIVPATLAGSRTGVFIGIGLNDYSRIQAVDQTAQPSSIDTYTTSGNALCIAANRISYTFDFRGPSMAVDTACSSSLVAIHLAVQSLRNGDATLALAGGTNLIAAPATSISLAKFLAPDGRCKFGDARADGYVRGEGAAVIVLKRLADAVTDGDDIYAVIRGTAVNQDGYSSGLTVPNGVAQQALVRQALANARVEPDRISYVEAHGTGTSLGDPIELHALAAALRPDGTTSQPLAVGSVKTNIGHLEAAAGIAGVVKVALALKHGQRPASLHFERPNAEIPFEQLRLRVQDRLEPWTDDNGSCLAGVSSFGFGGTNAHAILESAPSAPARQASTVERPMHLLALSARSPEALAAQAERYGEFLDATPAAGLADVCHAASTTRSEFSHRLAVFAESSAEMRDRLRSIAANADATGVVRGEVTRAQAAKVAFVFTGQGSQYLGMGRELDRSQPVFRAALDRCAALLDPLLDVPLRSAIYAADTGDNLLDRTAYTQPALFAVEYALAELWRSWGIEPAAAIGHSVGEYVAACIAGVFSLEDATKLIAARARLMQGLPAGGAMAAAFTSEARVVEALAGYEDRLSVAAINEPGQVVIAGAKAALEAVLADLQAEGIKVQPLNVSHAFHSPLMEPMLDAFEAVARTIDYKAPTIPLVANLTGAIWPAGQAPSSTYWRRHVREAVRFADGVAALHHAGCRVFLEVGPNPALLPAVTRNLSADDVVTLPSLRASQPAWETMLRSLGTLYTHGHEIDWNGFDRPYARTRTRLPTYPFQRQRYWFKPADVKASLRILVDGAEDVHPLLGQRVDSPAVSGTIFQAQLDSERSQILDEHRLYDTPVLPATALLEQALAATMTLDGAGADAECTVVVEDLVIQEALAIPDGVSRDVQVILDRDDAAGARFRTFSAPTTRPTGASDWRLHASGRTRTITPATLARPAQHDLGALQAACPERLDVAAFHSDIGEQGLAYGPSFRGIVGLWRGEHQALGHVVLPSSAGSAALYQVHPALLDACLQVFIAALPGLQDESGQPVYVPLGVERFTLLRRPGTEVWASVSLDADRTHRSGTVSGTLLLLDGDGRVLAEAEGVRFTRARRESLLASLRRAAGARQDRDDWFYEIGWREADALDPNRALRSEPPGRWLILTDRDGIGGLLTARLEQRGDRCIAVQAGERLEQIDDSSWSIDPSQPDHLRTILRESAETGLPWRGVVHLWSLDLPIPQGQSPLSEAQVLACGSALHVVQALADVGPVPLWLVTRGSQAVDQISAGVLAQAPVWAFGRTVLQERPELQVTCIDIDPAADALVLDSLVLEILAGDGEREVALRSGTRRVPRLKPVADTIGDASAAPAQPMRLDVPTRGTIDRVALSPMSRRVPAPGEVEIEVRASGLNFRDVLWALDLYPGHIEHLGNECSGVIAAVGAGVTAFQVGDAVLALADGSHGDFVTTDARLVVHKPSFLSDAEAASIPVTFATAWYGLEHLAGLRPGERVLIHAAAGGVGLAAVQIAQRIGAEVYATAGSPEKHEYLHTLGVRHIFSSRTTAFSDEIVRATNGQGVDVVLNSLADDFIPRSFDCLSQGGRFVEIGRRGIWDSADVRAYRPDAHYFPYLLADICQRDPALVQAGLQTIVSGLADGELRPLPVTTYPFRDAADAFRYMAQARHIGKIVLVPDAVAECAPVTIKSDGAYLITGGLGGIGLEVARWLADRGAQQLVLVGRNVPSPGAAAVVRELEARSIAVSVLQADVSCRNDVCGIVERLDRDGTRLRGVFHAAGVLDDGMLHQQEWSRFARVLAPKLDGAWNLHEATQQRDLDLFVLFSAGATLLGTAGQSSYVAANAFLDGLAHWRRANHLPALSVNWGRWTQVGMAAALSDEHQTRLADQGLVGIEPAAGVEALERALTLKIPQVAVLRFDRAQLAARRRQHAIVPTLVSELTTAAEPTPSPTVPETIRTQVEQTPPSQRRGLLLAHVRERVGRILQLDPSRTVDPRQPLTEIGLDSLMAVELRNALVASTGAPLAPTLLFDYPTLDRLVEHLLTDHFTPSAPPTPNGAPDAILAAHSATVRQLEQLSDDEAEQLLLAELGLTR